MFWLHLARIRFGTIPRMDLVLNQYTEHGLLLLRPSPGATTYRYSLAESSAQPYTKEFNYYILHQVAQLTNL